jgi:hypothetical protein
MVAAVVETGDIATRNNEIDEMARNFFIVLL